MIDIHSFVPGLKAIYHTLGCKLNFAETSTVASMMEARGVVRANEDDIPDFIFVNTCSVTSEADKKCRQYIRSMARRYPDAMIIVTGCYAQLKPDEVASLPGVVLVAGNDRKSRIVNYIDRYLSEHSNGQYITPVDDIVEFTPSCSRGDRTRYFLKVQDGCDYKCSYCTIPFARGRSRSGRISEIVAQAEGVAAEGGREIVITGVNIGDFGRRNGETFFDLCRALDRVEGIDRYRISSIEPNLLTDPLIDWLAGESKRFMPHFHIPLQCGDDEVLRLMGRRYDTALFRSKIDKIRSMIPDAFIGVDLIVGARGETPERFESSKRFIESLPISRLHVFTYSERPGTRALSIEYVVSQEDKHKRTRRMIELSDDKLNRFAGQFVGSVRPVLLEHVNVADGAMAGFTDNYLRVHVDADPSLRGRIVDVKLTGLIPGGEPGALRGEVIV